MYDNRTLEKYRAQANRMLALLSGNVGAALRSEAEEKIMEEGLTAINRLMLLRQARQVEEARVAGRAEGRAEAQAAADEHVAQFASLAPTATLPPVAMLGAWEIVGMSVPTGDR